MATRTISLIGGNWSATSAWAEGAVPTAADDVVAGIGAGNVAINSGGTRSCRSIDLTGYTGTLSGFTTLNIGDGTAGAGNVALKLVSGMTLTYTGSLVFNSTSGTQQTIDSGGKTLGGISFTGAGGSWKLAANLIQSVVASITSSNGTFNTNGMSVTTAGLNLSGSGVLTLGTSTITIPWLGSVVQILGGTLSAASSTIILTNTSGGSDSSFIGNGNAFGTLSVVTTGADVLTITGSNTFSKITTTGGLTKTILFAAGTTQTLTGGTDSFPSGAAGQLVTCKSDSDGSAWNLSKASGTVDCNYLSLQDSASAGGAVFTASNSTNVSGNSGWVFPSSSLPWGGRVSARQAVNRASYR